KPSRRREHVAARTSGSHRTVAGTRRDNSGSPRPLQAEGGSWLGLAFGRGLETVERAAGRFQCGRGDMEVAGGGAEAVVPEQDLDGAEVGTGLEQVSGGAVPQGMHMNVLAQARGLQGTLADHLDGARADRPVGQASGE